MKSGGNRVDPEVQALLARGKSLRSLPHVVRSRVLERARTTMTGPGLAERAAPVAGSGEWRWVRIAAAAAVFLVLVAAGAVAAFRGRVPVQQEVAPSPAPRMAPPLPAVAHEQRPVPPQIGRAHV